MVLEDVKPFLKELLLPGIPMDLSGQWLMLGGGQGAGLGVGAPRGVLVPGSQL